MQHNFLKCCIIHHLRNNPHSRLVKMTIDETRSDKPKCVGDSKVYFAPRMHDLLRCLGERFSQHATSRPAPAMPENTSLFSRVSKKGGVVRNSRGRPTPGLNPNLTNRTPTQLRENQPCSHPDRDPHASAQRNRPRG